MDAFVDTLVQLLIDWGYVGLFISALLAGSIIPFSSEIVMVALVKVGLSPALCVLSATLGNTLGGMTCYYMGRLGRIDWIENIQGKKGKDRTDDRQFPPRERGKTCMLSFRLSAFCGRGHSHCTGLHAQ